MNDHVKNEVVTGLLVGAVMIGLVIGALVINRNTEQWEKFKRDHHCNLVPDKQDVWLCDDGKTYDR